jgi:NADH-quinone oxidoreductase subunit A
LPVSRVRLSKPEHRYTDENKAIARKTPQPASRPISHFSQKQREVGHPTFHFASPETDARAPEVTYQLTTEHEGCQSKPIYRLVCLRSFGDSPNSGHYPPEAALERRCVPRYDGLLRGPECPRHILTMPQNYVPIFIFIVIVGTLLPITLLLAKLVRPENPSKTKLMPYECGIDPVDNARGRYTVRFYIIAILFVVFDVETIFLFPWAVKFKAFGLFGLVEMLIFLVILIAGYIWVWKKGALEWV